MVLSLKNLSLMAVAKTFWDKHEFEQRTSPEEPLNSDYQPAAMELIRQSDTLELPKGLKSELKLVILEIGKRKFARENMRLAMKLPTERPSRDRALLEFLPKFFAGSDARLRAPELAVYFPEEHHQTLVINFLFSLILTNPRDDPSAIRDCWTSPAFLPMQSRFLNNFVDIWNSITRGLFHQLRESRNKDELEALLSIKVFMEISTDNETLPWFIYEVLDVEQRKTFLALGQTTLMRRRFRKVFTTIFCHWPWQNRALDECFASKEHLSHNDIIVLDDAIRCKRMEEIEAMRTGILSLKESFYLKMETHFILM